jgi:hypothetical protein
MNGFYQEAMRNANRNQFRSNNLSQQIFNIRAVASAVAGAGENLFARPG